MSFYSIILPRATPSGCEHGDKPAIRLYVWSEMLSPEPSINTSARDSLPGTQDEGGEGETLTTSNLIIITPSSLSARRLFSSIHTLHLRQSDAIFTARHLRR
jgi:hypothetical protein